MTTVTISQFEVYRIDSDEAGGKNLIMSFRTQRLQIIPDT